MVDGSHLPLGENILYIKNISSLAHAKDMLVEAELGRLSGTEDGLTIEEYEARFTDIAQVDQFIDETGIDALAVCIGNVHRQYPPSGPNLRLDLLKRKGENQDTDGKPMTRADTSSTFVISFPVYPSAPMPRQCLPLMEEAAEEQAAAPATAEFGDAAENGMEEEGYAGVEEEG
ncbi:hypothetical protein ZWY2020_054020 [Hordeum vulgare]|nr:hypothetical protein ZWY2020_054020 [Hordeum vulgare]